MIRNLDLFKKTKSKEGTPCGGIVTLSMLLLMLFFLIYQTNAYLYPRQELVLTQAQDHTNYPIDVDVDMEFPKVPCHILSLDIQDEMMGHFVNIGNIQKNRLNSAGDTIFSNYEVLTHQKNPYLATKTAVLNKEGCRITGQFTLREVPGNFHVSFHGYLDNVILLRSEGLITNLDFTVKVHRLVFGDRQNIKRMRKLFPDRSFSLENMEFEMGTNTVTEIFMNLIKIQQPGLFTTKCSYMQKFNLYKYHPDETFLSGGLYVMVQQGEYNMRLKSEGVSFSEYVTWLLGILSGIFYLSFVADWMLRKRGDQFEQVSS